MSLMPFVLASIRLFVQAIIVFFVGVFFVVFSSWRRNSYAVAALEHFWNSWASARKDVILIVYG
jgi:hypothetical protein